MNIESATLRCADISQYCGSIFHYVKTFRETIPYLSIYLCHIHPEHIMHVVSKKERGE